MRGRVTAVIAAASPDRARSLAIARKQPSWRARVDWSAACPFTGAELVLTK
jgi:hypothetical protein